MGKANSKKYAVLISILLMLSAQSAVAWHDAVHHTHEHSEFCQVFFTAENNSNACLDYSIELPPLSDEVDGPLQKAVSFLIAPETSPEARAPPK